MASTGGASGVPNRHQTEAELLAPFIVSDFVADCRC